MVDDGMVLVAAPHLLPPEVEDELRLRFGMPARIVLCTPNSINAVVEKYYPRDAIPSAPAGAPARAGGTSGESPSGSPSLSQAGLPAGLGFAASGLFATVGFMAFRGGFDMMEQIDFLLILLLAVGGAAAGFVAASKRGNS